MSLCLWTGLDLAACCWRYTAGRLLYYAICRWMLVAGTRWCGGKRAGLGAGEGKASSCDRSAQHKQQSQQQQVRCSYSANVQRATIDVVVSLSLTLTPNDSTATPTRWRNARVLWTRIGCGGLRGYYLLCWPALRRAFVRRVRCCGTPNYRDSAQGKLAAVLGL